MASLNQHSHGIIGRRSAYALLLLTNSTIELSPKPSEWTHPYKYSPQKEEKKQKEKEERHFHLIPNPQCDTHTPL